jgi:hypothetical protein
MLCPQTGMMQMCSSSTHKCAQTAHAATELNGNEQADVSAGLVSEAEYWRREARHGRLCYGFSVSPKASFVRDDGRWWNL